MITISLYKKKLRRIKYVEYFQKNNVTLNLVLEVFNQID